MLLLAKGTVFFLINKKKKLQTLTASQINDCPGGRHRLLRSSFALLFLDITAQHAVFASLGEVAVAFLNVVVVIVVVVRRMTKLLTFWEPGFSRRHAM